MTVNIYTFVNGEQIIGMHKDHWEAIDGYSCIENPFYILEAQDEYGNNGMKLINVCTFSDQQYITVNNQHIVFSIPAAASMIRYYQKLLEAHNNADTTKMINDAIKDMEDMEEKMREIISKRLVGGSTVN